MPIIAQFDPTRRLLLARPIGGLNDMLVQIERAADYAQRHDRLMVLDTSLSGIQAPFDSLFEWAETVGPDVVIYTPQIGEALNSLTSVYPPAMRRGLLAYKTRWNREMGGAVERVTGEFLSFDMAHDHEAHLLVHHQAGGGVISDRALRRIRLRADVADEILSRILPLGRDYDAIHIRHSDYKTRYWRFLLLLRFVLKDRRVLICSDNARVKRLARRVLHPSTTLISVSDVPELAGRPLHLTKQDVPHEMNVNLLTDLFSMALSSRLFFTGVAAQHSSWRSKLTLWHQRFSGFSRLAERLRTNPDLVVQLLRKATVCDVDDFVRNREGQSNPKRARQIERQDRVNRMLRKNLREPKWLMEDGPLPDDVVSPPRLRPLYAPSLGKQGARDGSEAAEALHN